MNHTAQPVPREVTQAKLDLRSQASARYRASLPYTIADRLQEQAEQFADLPFLQEGDASYSYAETNRRINQVAHAARALGVKKGDVVALAMENRVAFFFVWWGLTKIGAKVAFLNTYVSGKPLAHALQVTGATHVVVGEECLKNFAQTVQDLPAGLDYWLWPDAAQPASGDLRALCSQNLERLADQADAHNPPAQWREGITAGDTALYIFTSGTTGLPKAAHVSHGRWLMAGDVMRISLEITPADCFYCFLPLYHGAASMSAGSTALAGGARVVVRRKFSRSAFWADVRRHQITVAQYVGEICRFLLSAPPSPDDKNHSLRKLSGTGMAPEVWQQWTERFGDQFQIIESWGATESNTNTLNLDNWPGSCGRVPFWEKTNLRLVRYDVETDSHPRDENGFLQLASVNEPGEAIGMIVQHPEAIGGRFEGYTSHEATEKKILRDVFQKGDAWWSSGDLLRCDEHGYCWFVDRIGDTFRWKSENVSTTEVADVLGDYPGLEALTIYGVKVPDNDGRAGMAAVVLLPGSEFDPAAFWKLAMERLPRYAAPLFVRLPAAADMTGNYKLRKVDLQREGFDTAIVKDPLFVRDDASQTYVPLTAEAVARALRG
ncbi:long-chain-acyl-CoA synthetase [Oryzisolibacter sp. LB2S]|uniref:long-chain-acyl-CoA synthetase n=1 Tax=Alicycliphilus soli TaxID=3228789 RepID=UPI0034594EC7